MSWCERARLHPVVGFARLNLNLMGDLEVELLGLLLQRETRTETSKSERLLGVLV